MQLQETNRLKRESRIGASLSITQLSLVRVITPYNPVERTYPAESLHSLVSIAHKSVLAHFSWFQQRSLSEATFSGSILYSSLPAYQRTHLLPHLQVVKT